jgi:hypothetical protein
MPGATSHGTDTSPSLLGSELVVEFLETIRTGLPSNTATMVVERLVEQIERDYGCKPEELSIDDDEANLLIKKLFAIANHRELEVASTSLNSI